MNATLKEAVKIWPKISKTVHVPHNDEEYKKVVAVLDELIDIVKDDEAHPLASLMEILSVIIEEYENEHYPIAEGSPREVLSQLMQEHGLHQKDLSEIGSQGVVSEILNGKRQLNARQIKALSRRFNVSPVVFI
jgi:HTH-type transcriptional regulator/antitoxin HigA